MRCSWGEGFASREVGVCKGIKAWERGGRWRTANSALRFQAKAARAREDQALRAGQQKGRLPLSVEHPAGLAFHDLKNSFYDLLGIKSGKM